MNKLDGLGEWKGYISELKNTFGELDELGKMNNKCDKFDEINMSWMS